MRVVRPPLALIVLLAALGLAACRSEDASIPTPAPPPETRVEPERMRAELEARCGAQRPAPPGAPCAELARVYDAEPRPLWWTPAGPTPEARALAAALRGAAARGLDPAHYAAGVHAAAEPGTPVPAALQAQRDVALSLAALRFVSDLAVGRVAPHEAGFALVPEAEVHDLALHVRTLARAHDVEAAIDAMEPPFETYRELEIALARYRRLAQDPALDVALPAASVRPGDALPGAAALRRRLIATRDLAAGPIPPGDVYDEALAAAVARFQTRHGLTPDGVLGPDTAEALRVPFEARAEQIALALERYRWLPHRFPAPPIAVNIPEFRLYALRGEDSRYSLADDRLTMKVIVGESWKRQTPVFTSQIRSVIFWPYWDVPASITREEMLPRIRREPEYLAEERLELVEAYGPAARVLDASAENLERLAAGALRLRQRPGLHNALGHVKFVFPNPYHVYMHGTPARSLFARERRDFSHGCIRVEDPLALAVWVLRHEPEWTRERIAQAMEGPQTREVRLGSPAPVYVLYLTAVARPDGQIHFFPDVYGLDERLAQLLDDLGPVRELGPEP